MNTGNSQQTHHIACNLCEAICGLEIKVENGQIKSIKGDKQDPASKGHICPKGVALQDIYNDPDRLHSPIRKTAEGWQKISWSQAFDEVASELKRVQKQYGRNAVAVYLGNPTVHNLEALLFGPEFFRTLRTQNRYSATSVDQLPEQLVSLLMFGHSLLIPLPDLDRTDFHLMFGANPLVSNGSMMTAPGVGKRLKAIQQRGGKLVVVDPRRTETAKIADLHLFIRPGTDVFVLLAMLHVVYNENLQSPGTVGHFTKGEDVIKKAVQDYPPERVADITGIEAAKLKSLVRDFCAAETASCYGRIGVSTQQFGALTQWLITVFNIVTGNLDIPGGTLFSKPAFEVLSAGKRGKKGFAERFSRVRKLPDFNGEFPVATLAAEITTSGEGQVKALVTSAGNPVLSTPNGHQLDAALGELDFMVSIDIYLNETTRHANIILPPLTGLERPHYDVVFQALAIRNGAKFSPPVFKAGADQRSDLQIFTELGWRMGADKGFKKAKGWFRKKLLQRLGVEWIINRKLKQGPYAKSNGLNLKKLKNNPHGIDLGPLLPSLPERLFTKDKQIHLAPEEFVSALEKTDEFIAGFEGAPETEFDLLLIGRRDPRTNNSWLHNSHRMVKGKNRCLALVHPQDAGRRQILDGDFALVSSRVGSIRIPVVISDDVSPGVVSIPHGWGHSADGIKLDVAQQHAGVNTNVLTDDLFLDSVSGNAALNGVPISLVKATN
ncbi:MAG: molybdopterin-dependent oxidoreductase [Xanthomonadales bacterium]|nr:molybdopterin-dependent oxidoreductase [Xanthomonadales bacterium]